MSMMPYPMINLGLQRVSELLRRANDPQKLLKVFHVAGTNGKGSVCTYLESVLCAMGKSTGKFTSPHLVRPSDAIQINRAPVDTNEYQCRTKYFQKLAEKHQIPATEFEIQTSVAFQTFKEHGVDYAVIEVGLGGTEDATNVLEPDQVLVSAITKVSIDHEGFLGTDLASIARHKAGIIKPGVPCVVDASNDVEVLQIVQNACEASNSHCILAEIPSSGSQVSLFRAQNCAVAVAALQAVFPQISTEVMSTGIKSAVWLGRQQWLGPNVLLDGAHNTGSAIELRKYVDKLQKPVKWVVAFSKPADPLLDILVRKGDEVIATEFGPVEGMPWIHPYPATSVADYAQSMACKPITSTINMTNVPELIASAKTLTVIGGSLYLVGQVLRDLESRVTPYL